MTLVIRLESRESNNLVPRAIVPHVQRLGNERPWKGLVRSPKMVVTRMDTPKYGEILRFVYIKMSVKSYQRFIKFNYGVTRTTYESQWPSMSSSQPNPARIVVWLLFVTLQERIDEKVNISRHLCLLLRYASWFIVKYMNAAKQS